jgi:Ca2+-binding EF-hand superfamily protein
MFKLMDIDGNGQISRAEYAASGKQMFADADTNHDGTVTLTEMTAACTKMKGDRPDHDQMSAAQMIKQHDTNMDGQLSAAEQAAGCDDLFAKMDTNSDGQLSQAEYMAGMKIMKNDHTLAH